MTADQRLIRRIEEVEEAVADDRLMAACHMLDEILQELDVPTSAKSARPETRAPMRGRTPPPFAAAG